MIHKTESVVKRTGVGNGVGSGVGTGVGNGVGSGDGSGVGTCTVVWQQKNDC
jgi:hypothetical protein